MRIVVIDKIGKDFDFKPVFFPRRFHYKKDAEDLVKEVILKGGEAHIEKEG